MTHTDDRSNTPLPLHLHTLDSLLRELISGRSVLLGEEDVVFRLDEKETRAILDWFFNDRNRWVGQVRSNDEVWEIVSVSRSAPTEYPAISTGGEGTAHPTYRVKSVRAHHFAGLQEYGANENVEYDLATGVTLFEGKNGSGKTALLNAPIWCLTGKILRSQQSPQDGFTDVDVKAGEAENEVAAKSVAVSPAPPAHIVKANANKNIPVDTWVEIVLADSDGQDLPPLKRRIYKDERGRLKEEEPDFSGLTLPPTAFETGTSMPGMLPLIRIGEANDIGRAIAELTGFNDLRNLADRARKLRNRMTRKMTKDIEVTIEKLQAIYLGTWQQLIGRLQDNVALTPQPAEDYPFLATRRANEGDLQKLRDHFESLEGRAFEQVKDILGPSFDPTDSSLRNELRRNAGQALGLAGFAAISRLDSATRLGRLKGLNDEEQQEAEDLIIALFKEYEELAELAAKPDLAARERLYASVAKWMQEADKEHHHLENCALCSSALKGKEDAVTGQPVRDHLQKRLDEPSDFLTHTLDAWRDHAEKRLSHELPEALRGEANRDLLGAPSDLMTQVLTEELFAQGPFQGSLAPLKVKMKIVCDEEFSTLSTFQEPEPLPFPSGFTEHFADLSVKLNRVYRALAFARWRKENATAWKEAVRKIIGPPETEERASDTVSLAGMLAALNAIVSNAEPIQSCLKNVDDLLRTLKVIAERKSEIENLAFTAESIEPLLKLGDLVDRQMDMLRVELHQETTRWKDYLYLRPSGTAPLHAETHVSSAGSLDFSSEIKGTRVPSQHVSNSSDMRATLFAFLIAFWKHVRDTHGGLDLLVFDDPHELFDRENQRKLSQTLRKLGENGAQLLISSFDSRFTDGLASALRKAKDVEFVHNRISPITETRPFVGHDLMERDLE